MKRLVAICCLLPLIALTSCRTTRSVYVHDTAYVAKEVHDSTFIDRWHTEYMKGDTVYVTEQQIISKLRTITDTVYKYVEKPVTVTMEQIKEVKSPSPWWQKGLMWAGVLSMLAVFAFAILKIRKSIK